MAILSSSFCQSATLLPHPRLLSILSHDSAVADERAVYLREQYSSAYRPLAYFVAKSLFALPVAAISCLLFSIFVYPICGFRTGFDRFMRFTVMLSLSSFVGQGAGLLVGACVSSKAKAAVLSPLSLAPIVLFTRYAVPHVPGWMRWLQVISPFWWAYDPLALDELGGLKLHCRPSEEFMVPWYSHGVIRGFPLPTHSPGDHLRNILFASLASLRSRARTPPDHALPIARDGCDC